MQEINFCLAGEQYMLVLEASIDSSLTVLLCRIC